jgi:Asp-tRNA(Asn)/Glu-tRNA(Gln) amidotransferase B subunit
VQSGGTVDSVVESLGIESVDGGELQGMLESLIDANPDEWARLVEGDRKLQGFFVGQIMQQTQGQADGKVVQAMIRERIG